MDQHLTLDNTEINVESLKLEHKVHIHIKGKPCKEQATSLELISSTFPTTRYIFDTQSIKLFSWLGSIPIIEFGFEIKSPFILSGVNAEEVWFTHPISSIVDLSTMTPHTLRFDLQSNVLNVSRVNKSVKCVHFNGCSIPGTTWEFVEEFHMYGEQGLPSHLFKKIIWDYVNKSSLVKLFIYKLIIKDGNEILIRSESLI
jgi:hypothetical protein